MVYNMYIQKINVERATDQNVRVGMTGKGEFPYTYIKGEMAKKSTLNGHKMAKSGPNDLKFGPVVYFNGFYQIPKNF